MKWIFYCYKFLFLFLFIFFVNSAMAGIPVTISAPQPALASRYDMGNLVPNIFTVTNNVPQHSFPLTVSGITGAINRIAVNNDCGSVIPSGPSTCQIGILISPQRTDEDSTISQHLAIDYQGRSLLSTTISFTVPPLIFPAQIAIAVGNYNSAPQYPLLAQVVQGPLRWRYVVDNTFLPTGYSDNGVFLGASCSENICTSGGSYLHSNGNTYPLLVQTTDNGNNWLFKMDSTITPTDFGNQGGFNATTCNHSKCVAGGEYSTSSLQYPLLAQTTDDGANWSYVIDSSLTPILYRNYGQFQSVSCSDSVCIAGGAYQITNNKKIVGLLAESINNGAWTYVIDSHNQPIDYTSRGDFYSTSYGGGVYVAAGSYRVVLKGYPMLAQSTDAGATWSYAISSTNLPSDFSNNGQLNGASCTNDFCIAVGCYTNTNQKIYPMIARSQHGAWTYVLDSSLSPPNYQSNAHFNASSCSNNFCIAAGNYSTDSGAHTFPLIAQSVDGGITWSYPVSNISPILPADYGATADLNSANCTGITCIASGYYTSGAVRLPLLVMTIDGGQSWFYRIYSNNLPRNFQELGLFRVSGMS